MRFKINQMGSYTMANPVLFGGVGGVLKINGNRVVLVSPLSYGEILQ